ncbi:exopolysaccharide biosynthesis protein [Chelativorans sp. YIM 93263]|uniref:exopolysaccharide biosynthesis protein n=1 Tax=Chelativorans sp. YIM 93263 TaxID=2906648 RepID=UPI002378F195|nr:exopolysaccharide biosynthesis protein [Chelativorans sp. YIM 93263]
MRAEGTGLDAQFQLPPRRISRILNDLAREAEGTITFEQIRQALGDRSFATLLVLFSCLNLLPFPPGSTLILGAPLLLLAVQMIVGRRTVWLPRFLLRRSVTAETFRRMSDRFAPRLEWIERFIRPRMWPSHRRTDRIVGLLVLVLAIATTLPVPFGNWFPALACALTGLALSERDGLLFAIAVIVSMLALTLFAALISAASLLANFLAG